MKRTTIALLLFLIVISFSVVSAQEVKDQEFKKTHIQVVIHRLLPGNNNETFEFTYNPRELKSPHRVVVYGVVKQLVSEYVGCSNDSGDIWVVIGRKSKNRYIISIAMSDKPQPFSELETWTYFNSFKEGEEILRTQVSPSSNKTYQISVRASRFHAYQGGSILQCHKHIFPVDPRSGPN